MVWFSQGNGTLWEGCDAVMVETGQEVDKIVLMESVVELRSVMVKKGMLEELTTAPAMESATLLVGPAIKATPLRSLWWRRGWSWGIHALTMLDIATNNHM